ncbi:MAG: flagellar export chaperone FliS [Candidatus Glassbacteria bacterium RIFCSPLOWO2_12_FULL_58_11]|uniref:Flagellar export chaperone FliS n=2 Tax=Candidatus Glassiibacteriota TaxID=1817805 RepID=A0A1F5YSX8_9BACT|nr:MAG: flagellar export chaperone FliS [Candidatus Glassbacteria bacterium GWA2_58_10]OGG03215.1 MAG: flagellar export chaperone FliS [Candidatus Glassbacteria bacterium RIFCSPLOWO2_12_FULL_58_11]
MQKKPGVHDYRSMQILSSKPEKLILLLYDGAIRFIQLAIKSIESNEIEPAHKNLVKAQNIMVELMASLNFDKGGELAVNLFRIYEFMHFTLVQANIKKNPKDLARITEQLKKLRHSWNQALKGPSDKAGGLPENEAGAATAAGGKSAKSITVTG